MKKPFQRIDQLLAVQKRLEQRPEFRMRRAKNDIAGSRINRAEALWSLIEMRVRMRLAKLGAF